MSAVPNLYTLVLLRFGGNLVRGLDTNWRVENTKIINEKKNIVCFLLDELKKNCHQNFCIKMWKIVRIKFTPSITLEIIFWQQNLYTYIQTYRTLFKLWLLNLSSFHNNNWEARFWFAWNLKSSNQGELIRYWERRYFLSKVWI